MIKAKELRIGNYVKDSDTGRIGYLLSFSNKKTTVKLNYSTIWKDIDEFEPIPLTEEILLKCGFEKDHEWFQKEIPIIGVLCQNETKEYLFDENTDTLRIRCLHQLQNLYFALSGQELEVTF